MSLSKNIISSDTLLLEAIGKLNSLSGNVLTLFIVDENGRMLGTLTDGDVRRSLLGGIELNAPALKAANRNFKAIQGEISGKSVEALKSFREQGILLIPRLDDEGRISEIIDLRETANRLPVNAILMAGGKGERLRPMTLDCPKPLLKIEGKAIIDYNVEALAALGVKDITVATRYLADQIEEHFAKPVGGVQVRCVKEDKPLGTIGACSLVSLPAEGSTVVMNSDLITSISFEEFYLRHLETEADITIGVVPYQVAIPFAVLTLDGEKVTGLSEKPVYSYYANAGIYLVKNKVLATLNPDERTDATDLIERTIESGGKVSYYPIKGTWIDVGSPSDFRHAAELMRHHKAFEKK